MKFAAWKIDILIIACIFLTALAFRAPYVSHPGTALLDEGSYASWINLTKSGHQFFELHPPLYWLIMSSYLSSFTYDVRLEHFARVAGNFFDFPIVAGRALSVIAGSLLPVVIYILMRLLLFAPSIAVIPAFFIVIDSALVLYSRILLPDILLLLLGFLGLAAAFGAERMPVPRQKILVYLLAGIFIGLAMSIKWTALGFLVAAFLVIVWHNWKYFWFVVIGAFLTYLMIFYSYVQIFDAGPVDVTRGYFDTAEVKALYFPGIGKPVESLKFIHDYNLAIWRVNTDSAVKEIFLMGDRALYWPTGYSVVNYWDSLVQPEYIRMHGNHFTWVASFLAVLFICWQFLRKRASSVIFLKAKTFLLGAFAVNYIPFFLIGREMHLYHYFTAVIFSFMAFAVVFDEWTAGKPRLRSQFYIATAVFSVAVFVILFRTTYGI